MNATTQEVKFSCKCGQHLVAPADAFGQTIECPGCGKQVMLPSRETLRISELRERLDNDPAFAERLRIQSKAEALQMLGNCSLGVSAICLFAVGAMLTHGGGGSLAGLAFGGFLSGWFCLTLVAQVMHVRALLIKRG